MAVLLLGAFVFYRERMFSDAAYIAFNIINTHSLQIQEYRYGSFITQVFPLAAASLHLPVKVALIAYSASFNIFYLSVALVLFYRFKEYALVVLMGLYYTLYFSDAYFWTNCELHQGVSWMFLAFGTLRYFCAKSERANKAQNLTLGICIFLLTGALAISSHPQVIILFLFLWVFFWLVQDSAPFTKKYSIILFGFILLASVIRYLRSTRPGYDSNLLSGLQKATFADIAGTFTSGMADTFWQGVVHNHWLLPLILITGVVVLFRQRKYQLVAYLLLANVGFFVLLCLTFKALSVSFHFESEFCPFSILCGAAFVWYVLPSLNNTRTVLAVVVMIFTIRLIYIGAAAPKFVARIKRVDAILACMKSHGTKKLLIPHGDGQIDNDLMLGWALPYETLLYSKVAGDSVPATAICLDNDDKVWKDINAIPKTTFYGPWERLNAKAMSPELMTDTVQQYVSASYQAAQCQ